jgi:hypothetical protein
VTSAFFLDDAAHPGSTAQAHPSPSPTCTPAAG